MAIVLAHELDEVAVHAQDHEHLELRIVEERIALCEDVASAAEDALVEALGTQCADLAVRARGHQRDEAVELAPLVRLLLALAYHLPTSSGMMSVRTSS